MKEAIWQQLSGAQRLQAGDGGGGGPAHAELSSLSTLPHAPSLIRPFLTLPSSSCLIRSYLIHLSLCFLYLTQFPVHFLTLLPHQPLFHSFCLQFHSSCPPFPAHSYLSLPSLTLLLISCRVHYPFPVFSASPAPITVFSLLASSDQPPSLSCFPANSGLVTHCCLYHTLFFLYVLFFLSLQLPLHTSLTLLPVSSSQLLPPFCSFPAHLALVSSYCVSFAFLPSPIDFFLSRRFSSYFF